MAKPIQNSSTPRLSAGSVYITPTRPTLILQAILTDII
jgi:hypothetical protein